MRALLAVASLLLVAGCGEATVVVDAPPASTPYAGRLDLPVSYRDSASVMKRSGSSGLALECTGRPSNGGGADYDSGLSTVQSDPAGAVADWMHEEGSWFSGVPDSGYRLERRDDGRVLYSFDVDGRTRAAVIVSDSVHDWNGDTGWGVESWAVCDPAELPAEMTEEMGIVVWEDAAGNRVPTSRVTSYAGPEHCDWQDITFLNLGGPRGTQFLRDVDGELSGQTFGRFDGSVALPDDATDTGWHHDGRELWLADDERAAYLVSLDDPSDVERWPAAKEPVGCA